MKYKLAKDEYDENAFYKFVSYLHFFNKGNNILSVHFRSIDIYVEDFYTYTNSNDKAIFIANSFICFLRKNL